MSNAFNINISPNDYVNIMFIMMGPGSPGSYAVDNKDGTFTGGSNTYIGIKNTFNISFGNDALQIPSTSPDNKILYVLSHPIATDYMLKKMMYMMMYIISNYGKQKTINLYSLAQIKLTSKYVTGSDATYDTLIKSYNELQFNDTNRTDDATFNLILKVGIYQRYLVVSNPSKYSEPYEPDKLKDINLVNDAKIYLDLYKIIDNDISKFCANLYVTGPTVNSRFKFLDCASNPNLSPDVPKSIDDVANFYNQYGMQIGIGCCICCCLIIICAIIVIMTMNSATKKYRRSRR
jgi:hypothetical protein